DEAGVFAALARTHDLPFERPDPEAIEEDVFNAVGADYAKQHGVVGLRRDEHNRFMVGVTDPANVFLLDEVRRKVRRDITAIVVTPSDVVRVCEAMAGVKG